MTTVHSELRDDDDPTSPIDDVRPLVAYNGWRRLAVSAAATSRRRRLPVDLARSVDEVEETNASFGSKA